jgi:hypothetical protein
MDEKRPDQKRRFGRAGSKSVNPSAREQRKPRDKTTSGGDGRMTDDEKVDEASERASRPAIRRDILSASLCCKVLASNSPVY